jgi:Ca2+/H+ antiporter, TMEM165/GDT1 family
MKKGYWARKVVMIILFAAVALTAFGGIVMWLWNAILPSVLGVSTITFWQALGILLLSKILFGGFHGGWSRKKQMWKHSIQQKWANMTPEEREKLKEEMKNRCGHWRKNRESEAPSSTPTTEQ